MLSLFFIDEVDKYKCYDAAGQPYNGIYAEMFEQEYEDIVGQMQLSLGEDDYIRYLKAISAHDTHAGYFSVDKKGHFVNQVAGDDKREKTSNDISAYDLIMKNKELLLDRDPKRSPVRFIFSHSALREGWDNPNVFQICTLKQSSSEVRKRQEVGRGLRLCVNQNGERMDANDMSAPRRSHTPEEIGQEPLAGRPTPKKNRPSRQARPALCAGQGRQPCPVDVMPCVISYWVLSGA